MVCQLGITFYCNHEKPLVEMRGEEEQQQIHGDQCTDLQSHPFSKELHEWHHWYIKMWFWGFQGACCTNCTDRRYCTVQDKLVLTFRTQRVLLKRGNELAIVHGSKPTRLTFQCILVGNCLEDMLQGYKNISTSDVPLHHTNTFRQ